MNHLTNTGFNLARLSDGATQEVTAGLPLHGHEQIAEIATWDYVVMHGMPQ
jgi:hypothetical protein